MSFLKALNRYMERNQAASRALLNQLDKADITEMRDLAEFSTELWTLIESSSSQQHALEVIDDGVIPLEFIVKLFVKMGFSCEDSIRLMMKAHKDGRVMLAQAEEETLLTLQDYINSQARSYGVSVSVRIIKT